MPQKKEAEPAKHETTHRAKEPAKHATAHRAKEPAKKTLGERWDDLTEGHFGTIIYIFLGFLIALAVNEGLKPVLATDTPVVAVFSESMLPTFEKRDMIIVQGGVHIKVDDIVVYDAPSYKYPIIHRVINVSEEGITTKGDHNSAADPWVTPISKVHGKAITRIPYLGWVKVGAYELLGLV